MKVLIIDAQGGGIGKQLISALKHNAPQLQITAVGTNTAATAVMLKAGADCAATGENASVVQSRTADVIAGPVGIVIADSLLGEITPNMAVAIGQSPAKKILIPSLKCNNYVVGTRGIALDQLINLAVEEIAEQK